jgi:phage terminase large subunit
MAFQRTTAIDKLLDLTKRKKVVQGGTWAGKTYGIVPLLIDKCAALPDKHITIVCQTLDAVRKGPLRDFKNIMQGTGRWIEDSYHGTDRIYTFANGSIIEFQAYDSIGKAKAAGKRTDLFINEAQYVSFEIADTLITRTSEDIWLDFNPTYEFWAHTEILTQDDAEFLLLKYSDNEALPLTILEDLKFKLSKAYFNPDADHRDENNIKSAYWANWCKVYIDGEIGSLEGVIFNNWDVVDGIPSEARLIGAGMDFGFTNDPTTLIAAYKYNGQIIYDEVIYETGLLNPDIARLIKAEGFKARIYADSAEPKTIETLKRSYKINIEGATKGADSIRFGIQLMQNDNFLVTSRSSNIIRELRAYSWKKKKDGTKDNEPIDAFNHCIDAMRYFCIMTMQTVKKTVRIKARRRK